MTGPRGYHPRRPQIDALPLPELKPAQIAQILTWAEGDALQRDRDCRRMQQRAYGQGVHVEGDPSPETLMYVSAFQKAAQVMRLIEGHEEQFKEWARRVRAKDRKEAA